MKFIDINIPSNGTQLNAYYETRKSIFCDEQKLFKGSDYDKKDQLSIPIIALDHYCGSPDEVIGVVRIYENEKREWFGGRLGVVNEYRTFTKYVCPNLFNKKNETAFYKMSVAAGLIYRAVTLANYLGCDKFLAHVQEQNVKLFKRLHWTVIGEVSMYGVKHFLMEADLEAYPATPIYASSTVNIEGLLNSSKVA